MTGEFQLERFIRPKKIYQKFGIELLDYFYDLSEPIEVADGGFVNITTPEPVNQRRANYLRKLGVRAKIGNSGDQVLTFHQSTVENLIRLAKRPWVQQIQISKQLYPF